MKYKVGDKVRVRKDLVVGNRYGSIFCLLGHEKDSGKIFTIKNIRKQCYYRLNGSGYWWTEEMFEDVAEMGKIEIIVDGNKVIAKKEGKFGVARCHPDDKFDIFTGARIALDRLEEECKPYGWLKEGACYYRPAIIANEMYTCTTYDNDGIDKRMISRGLVFKTKEEAIEAAKKMLAVLKEADSNDE